MGPLQYVNTLISENNLDVRFSLTRRGNFKTEKYPNKRAVIKIEEILQTHGIFYYKRKDTHRRTLFLLIKRDSIPVSTLAWRPVRQDILLEEVKIESLGTLKKVFCWSYGIPRALNRFPFLSLENVALPYDSNHRPLFDERWINLIKSLIDQDSTYTRPSDILIQAQNLSHKFLDRTPQLLEQEYQRCHPAILLTALCIVIKVGDECGLTTLDIVEHAFDHQVPHSIENMMAKSMCNMERVFLKAINYDTHFDEPIEHSMGLYLSRASLDANKTLSGKEKGTYLIQKKQGVYLFTVVIDKEQHIFQQKKFTIDENLNFVEVLPKDSKEIPKSDHSLIALITNWGGKP